MRRHLKFIQKTWRQQGAILAFTALLLPMIIVGTGLAVDLGNIYVQHARLQNAADAAVLAGAQAFAQNNDQPEKGKHKHADDKAREYIKGTYHNLEQDEDITNYEKDEKIFKAAKDNNVIYYKVILEKEVPLYFLGSFYEKIEGKRTFTVPAESVAAIQGEANKGWFNNNMIIFKSKFHDVNSIENPDTWNNNNYSQDFISDTYDGYVSYTNGNGKNEPSYRPKEVNYSAQNGELGRLFTSAAQKYYQETHDKSKLRSDETKVTDNFNTGFWSEVKYTVYNFDDFITYMDEKTEKAVKITDQNYNATENNLKSTDILRVSSSVPNFSFTVSESLGNNSNPLYVFVEAGAGLVKFNLNADNKRPIIFCLGGNNDKRCQVEFYLNGHTFNGVFYAPYCEEWRGVLFKSNGQESNFIGTFVASAIDIQNGKIHFAYKDYLGSSSSDGTITNSSVGISLVSQPDSIKWE